MTRNDARRARDDRTETRRTRCKPRRRGAGAAALLASIALLAAAAPAAAQTVGEVVFVRGVATAQADGQPARFIGQGDSLSRADVITVAPDSFALLTLADGSRVTLRERSVMALDEVEVADGRENAVLRLFRGGLRMLTGFISKRRPGAYRIRTPVATIGIRGTDFDARLCEGDCAGEARELGADAEVLTRSRVIARVVRLRGTLTGALAGAAARPLGVGGPIYEADTLSTGERSFAVVAFRDGTKVTLRPDTRFVVERFSFQPAQPKRGSAFMRLLRGGMRAVTGLIARQRRSFFTVAAPTVTIGIRGTGFDLYCEGACAAGPGAQATGEEAGAAALAPPLDAGASCRADEDFVAHVWQGAIGVQQGERVYGVESGQVLCMADGTASPVLAPAIPEFVRDEPAPRPDGVDVDTDQLFDAQAVEDTRAGLYVAVRDDGHLTIERGAQSLDIGGGETAYAERDGPLLIRVAQPPVFMEFDPYPLPSEFDEQPRNILQLFDEGIRRPGEGPMQCVM